MADVEKIVVKLIGEGSSYQRMLKQAMVSTIAAEKSFKSLNAQIRTTSQSMKKLGKSMTFRVTLPLIALGVAAIKVGADFQSGFAGVEKTVDATDAELAVLKQGFKDLASEIPIAVEELLGIGEIAGQLGIANDQILDFTETIAMLGVTTNLSTEDAATSLARFSNITGLSQDKISNLGSTIVALGNSLATSEKDIVSMATRLAGAGSTIGLSEDQILAMAGALSSVGLEAEAGGSSFSKLFLQMSEAVATGNDELGKFAEVSGRSISEFKTLFRTDAVGAVQALLGGLNELGAEDKIIAIKDLGVESIRMTDALLRSSSAVDLLATALTTAETAFDENTALAKEAEVRFKSFWSMVQLLTNQFKLLLTDAFDVMEPVLRQLIERVKVVVKWFMNLSPEIKRVGIIIAVVVGVIGPLLIILGILGTAISAVIAAVTAIISVLNIWIVVAAAVVAWVVAIGVAFIKLYDIDIVSIFVDASTALINFGKNVVGFLRNWGVNWELAFDWLKDNWQNLLQDMTQLVALYITGYINNTIVMIKTAVRLWVFYRGMMAGVWKAIFSVDYIKWVKFGIREAAKLQIKHAGLISQVYKDAYTGKDTTGVLDDFLETLQEDFKAGLEFDFDRLGEILNDGIKDISLNPFDVFETTTTDLPDFLFNSNNSNSKLLAGYTGMGESIGMTLGESIGMTLGEGLEKELILGLDNERILAAFTPEDFAFEGIKDELDELEEDIEIRFSLIDATTVGSAEALSRIDEYLALRGTTKILPPMPPPIPMDVLPRDLGALMPPPMPPMPPMPPVDLNLVPRDIDFQNPFFREPEDPKDPTIITPELSWNIGEEGGPEDPETQEGILEAVETLVEQGKAQSEANFKTGF